MQTTDQIPYALTIRQADDPLTFMAQPGPATTLGELALACKEFELKCWINPIGEVLLVSRLQRTTPLPDSAELARVMWGLCIFKEDPHAVSRSDAGSIFDDDPTPDVEGEPPATAAEIASRVPPR